MTRRVLSIVLLLFMFGTAPSSAQAPFTDLPDDPDLSNQWAVETIGLGCAWNHTTGSPDVTVAVIDSGIDPDHPDLVDAIRDDGYNAVDDNNDPTDLNGHGTHVAGIIAATGNNGQGIAGVASGTRILPIRVMQPDGSGTNADIIAGIRYAVDKRVQIINMSLGSLLPLGSDDIVDAIKDAHDAGVLVVVAAGNSYLPLPNFALNIDKFALVVAATDRNDRKTDFSNYGPWVAVSAPGDEIISTMPTYPVYLTTELPPDQRFKQDYDALSGTSQATPIVAGVAALLFAAHPDWNADQVMAEIKRTATDITEQNPPDKVLGISIFEPRWLGAGRINACDALGGPITAVAGGSPGTIPWLVIGLVAAGLVVVLLAISLLRRSRRTRTAVAPAPVYPPPAYPPSASAPPPPYAAPAQSSAPEPTYDRRYASPPLVPPASVPPPAPPRSAAPAAQFAPTAGARMPAWGKLTVEQGPNRGEFSLLRQPVYLIGREAANDLIFNADPTISRRHVRIERDADGAVWVEDAGSTHGTHLNGRPLTGRQQLHSDDRIQLGQTTLRFEA